MLSFIPSPQARLPQNIVDDINAALAAVKEAQEGEDAAALKEKITALSNASMKIGEALNANTSSSSGSAGGSSEGGSSGTGGSQ